MKGHSLNFKLASLVLAACIVTQADAQSPQPTVADAEACIARAEKVLLDFSL